METQRDDVTLGESDGARAGTQSSHLLPCLPLSVGQTLAQSQQRSVHSDPSGLQNTTGEAASTPDQAG